MPKNVPIPESFDIPFFDHGKTLLSTVKTSAHRRKMTFFEFAYKKIRNIVLYRFSFFCPINSLRIRMHRWRGITIGSNCYIGQQVVFDNAYPEYIFIGNNVAVNQGTTVLVHNNIKPHFRGLLIPKVDPVIIGDYALIGINSTILPGVKIGKYSVVSAGSVVRNSVSDFLLVQGNPAKKVVSVEAMLVNLHDNQQLKN